MSHEFRSPLNSILALSGLLLGRTDGDLSGDQVQQVEYIRRAADDLLELVNDLLDLAKVEAGKVEVKPLEFTAGNLFGALRGMLRPLLLNQSVNLVFEDVDQIPVIFGDEGKVSQVLRNFISNSLKFTESGEVRVSATLESDAKVIFSVSDTGIGIAPENQELIFQDFAQVDSPIQRRVKGTGLGLPLSKKLAKVLGGEVRVKSSLGVGSTFTLEIPLRYRDSLEERGSEASALAWNRESGKPPVLIVEDDAVMKIMYNNFLEGSPFQAVHASTIREADQILDQMRPAAIVLDVVLRSEDSWTFLARHAEDARTQGIPILVVSSIEDQGKAYHLGANGYLVKPINRADLIQRLTLATGHSPVNRVLIIDDDERDRYLFKHQLRDASFLVLEASGGREGIRKASEEKPHVIVLDINMPDMTGFEVVERLKAQASTKDIPVVICTSRILTNPERTQLTDQAVSIIGKESREKSDVAERLRRIINGTGMATSIH
jgi:CheY-like chemotaxis protein